MQNICNAKFSELQYCFFGEIRGYDEYKTRWVPVLHKVLPVKHEFRNCHDRYYMYAIGVIMLLPGTLVASVVGHLPRKGLTITYLNIVHGV